MTSRIARRQQGMIHAFDLRHRIEETDRDAGTQKRRKDQRLTGDETRPSMEKVFPGLAIGHWHESGCVRSGKQTVRTNL